MQQIINCLDKLLNNLEFDKNSTFNKLSEFINQYEYLKIKFKTNKYNDSLISKTEDIKIENKLQIEEIDEELELIECKKSNIQFKLLNLTKKQSKCNELLSEEQNKFEKNKKNNIKTNSNIINIEYLNKVLNLLNEEQNNLLNIDENLNKQKDIYLKQKDKYLELDNIKIEIEDNNEIKSSLLGEIFNIVDEEKICLFFNFKDKLKQFILNFKEYDIYSLKLLLKEYNNFVINENVLELKKRLLTIKEYVGEKLSNEENYRISNIKLNLNGNEYDYQLRFYNYNIINLRKIIKNSLKRKEEYNHKLNKLNCKIETLNIRLNVLSENYSKEKEEIIKKIKEIKKEIKKIIDKIDKLNKYILINEDIVTNYKKNIKTIDNLMNSEKTDNSNILSLSNTSIDTYAMSEDYSLLEDIKVELSIINLIIKINNKDNLDLVNAILEDKNEFEVINWQDCKQELLNNVNFEEIINNIRRYFIDGE